MHGDVREILLGAEVSDVTNHLIVGDDISSQDAVKFSSLFPPCWLCFHL